MLVYAAIKHFTNYLLILLKIFQTGAIINVLLIIGITTLWTSNFYAAAALILDLMMMMGVRLV